MTVSRYSRVRPAPKWVLFLGFVALVLGLIPGLGLVNWFFIPALGVVSTAALCMSDHRYGRIYLTWLLMVVAAIVTIVVNVGMLFHR